MTPDAARRALSKTGAHVHIQIDWATRDSSAGIREGVAHNPSTPVELLAELCKDSNSDVRIFANKTLNQKGVL